jgi:methionine-rich copper-binding protein CopC
VIRWLVSGLVALSVAGGADLSGSSPADGAILDRPPSTVDMTFAGRPDPSLSHVSVRSVGGENVAAGEPVADRDTLRQPVRITANGEYSAAYHVVLADGRNVSGVVRFTVGTGVPPSAGAQRIEAEHAHGIDPLGGMLLLADALVLAAVVGLLWLRRPARRVAPAGGGPTSGPPVGN